MRVRATQSGPILARVTAPATEEAGLARLARYTIPFHLLLPWLLWALSLISDQLPFAVFVAFHALFPVVLVITFRWWKNEILELVMLLVVNHLATFVSGALAAWVASAV